jgi:hypothetical protein
MSRQVAVTKLPPVIFSTTKILSASEAGARIGIDGDRFRDVAKTRARLVPRMNRRGHERWSEADAEVVRSILAK